MLPNEYLNESKRTDLEDYTPVIHRFGESCSRSPELLHAVVGLSTEAGEALDVLKKHLMYGKPIDTVNLAEEFGDALWYIALGLRAMNFSFEEIMLMNINKLRKRFPEKFTQENATNRNLKDEREQLEIDFKKRTHVID